MKLSGPMFQQLQEALFSAFPERQALTQMVRYRLDEDLEIIAGGQTYPEVTYNLIRWAEAGDRVEELVAKAREQNLENTQLRKVQADLQKPSPEPGVDEGQPGPLEMDQPPFTSSRVDTSAQPRRPPNRSSAHRLPFLIASPLLPSPVDTSAQPERLLNWCRRMLEVARAVCRIEVQNTMATGFLVGPRLLLTTRYVFGTGSKLLPDGPDSVRLRFDYQVGSDGVTINEGVVYHLAEQWLVDEDEQLDYALVLTAGSPGTDRAGNRRAIRGWLRLEPWTLVPGDPMYLLGHPFGRPLHVVRADVVDWDSTRTRIKSYANSIVRRGAAGAPCFTAAWKVVAMHERVDRGEEGQWLDAAIAVGEILAQPRVALALAISNE